MWAAGAAVLYVALATAAASRSSATWDEPIHLAAGYAALVDGDYRVDPSHPPLIRMWAALPVVALGHSANLDTGRIDSSSPTTWLGEAYSFAHRFMFGGRDAERMLTAARAMIILLGAGLAALLFAWARSWLGFVPAAAVVILSALEPNLLAHGSLVTTDVGVTVFAFAAIYFLWRTCERPTPGRVGGAAVCAALALVTKFSALVLAPVVVILLALAVWTRALSIRTAAAVAGAMVVTAVAAIWAVYGFRYLPSGRADWAFDFGGSALESGGSLVAQAAAWVDRYGLLPNAYAQGLVYAQSSSQQMPGFLAGQISEEGWWYYFPVALLIKTPIALLLLVLAGAWTLVRRREPGALQAAFLVVPVAVFLGVAMTSGINLGLRHVLPIYPFLLLLAGVGTKGLLAADARRGAIAVTIAVAAGGLELARSYPNPLAFFNQLVGGPANGYRYLADSNVDWGGDLERLAGWMRQQQVDHINLAYFGQADPAFYGLSVTHLPGAPGWATDAIARPRLPGYVAISPTIMHGVYSPTMWRVFYEPFAALEPVAVLGHALRIYRVDAWPIAEARPDVDREAIAARRTLGDALLLGLQWPEPAIGYYRDYLRHEPRDADALLNLGVALASAGRIAEVVPTLTSAVEAAPDHGRARLTLARALFGSGDLAGAASHAERAVHLLPQDADAHAFLGRVRGAQGRLPEALDEFRRALQIDPSHPQARERFAMLTRKP